VVADLETLKQSIVAARRMVRSKWAAADSWFKLSCMNHSAAHKRFTSALEAAGQPNLLEEVVLGLLIAYISGAAGGAAAGAMKKGVDKLKNEVLKGAFTDANKDFVKALVKLGAGALVKEPKKGGVLNDPFRYYLEISAVLTDEREVLDSALDAMEDRATKAGPSDVITELPDQILERALPDSFIEQAKEPVQSETQYLTSMWKTWLRTYGYTLARVSNVNNNVGPRPSYRYEVRDNVSGKFRDVIRSQAESCGQNPDTWFAEANIAKEAAQKQLSDLAKPSE